MLPFWVLLLFVQNAASATSDPEVAWYSAPNFRGTWDLIVSCVLTLVICVWSALHLNVPVETSRLRERNTRRLRWVLLGIFAPEVVVSTAFAQFLTARWLKKEIRADIKYRNKDKVNASSVAEKDRTSEEWSMSQCYFAVMGGIVIETGDYIAKDSRLSITAEGVRLLSFLDKLPNIDHSEVRDKSKADGLAKLLVILQAGWMIIQCIARVAQDLPVTLLEINTIGHVICAFALYMLWWGKPLDVKEPHSIVGEHGLDKHVALMYMCSPVSGNQEDEISEIRCLAYTLPDDRSMPTTTRTSHDAKALEASVPKFHSTRFSLGSIGARNPLRFLGPLQKVRDVNGEVQYTYKCDRVAVEHEEFFRLQGLDHCLQHTRDYCRKTFEDCKEHAPLSDQAKRRWSLANDIVQELWDECEKRKEYTKVFFTWSTLGIFVGEPIYVADRVPNFPGFSYLGSVNVQRDILKIVVAFAGAAYGGLHLSAWNDYFPTRVERIMWIACACATGLTGLVLALFFLATNQLQQLEAAENRMRNNKHFKSFLKGVLVPLFMAARVFIIVEAFICLRRQPEAVYKTPEWSNYIPHL